MQGFLVSFTATSTLSQKLHASLDMSYDIELCINQVHELKDYTYNVCKSITFYNKNGFLV